MSQVSIRELQIQDLAEVNSMYALYWPDQEFLARLTSRMQDFIAGTQEMVDSEFIYFVAEQGGEIVGVAGMRKVPIHMSHHVAGDHACELYILAVKNKYKGIGKALVEKIIATGKERKYTDLILYSGETHKDSYGFYEHLGFEIRDDNAVAPNGEKGVIFRMRL